MNYDEPCIKDLQFWHQEDDNAYYWFSFAYFQVYCSYSLSLTSNNKTCKIWQHAILYFLMYCFISTSGRHSSSNMPLGGHEWLLNTRWHFSIDLSQLVNTMNNISYAFRQQITWMRIPFKEKLRRNCPNFELNPTIVAKRTHFWHSDEAARTRTLQPLRWPSRTVRLYREMKEPDIDRNFRMTPFLRGWPCTR